MREKAWENSNVYVNPKQIKPRRHSLVYFAGHSKKRTCPDEEEEEEEEESRNKRMKTD